MRIKERMEHLEEEIKVDKEKYLNLKLKKAADLKNDEFYTYYKDIEIEMEIYKEYLKGKTIYLPCDNPEFSNFYKYFKDKFKYLELKKLICTYLDEEPKIYIYNGEEETIINNEDGDFRASCNKKYFIECDFVITNPPFSIKQELLDIIEEYNKNFILILPLTHLGTVKTYKKMIEREYKISNSVGKFYSLFSNKTKNVACYFFNNIKDFKFTKKPKLKVNFKKYDDYDALECPKLEYLKLLKDYKGNIGVPITILLNVDDYKDDYIFVEEKPMKPKLEGKYLFNRIIIKKK